MDRNLIIFIVVILIFTFVVGFRSSYISGIQPGYFEKAEAPAYGVGGDLLGADMDGDFQDYLKSLDLEEDDD